jgi:hypothetical protein
MATSPDQSRPADDDLRPEYDFRSMPGVVRGKYAEHYRERLRVVRLADDVATEFADEAEVNEALREYLRRRRSEHAPTSGTGHVAHPEGRRACGQGHSRFPTPIAPLWACHPIRQWHPARSRRTR